MDEPGWSWPAWKFGMKRDDLFTKLHDQYNTFPSSIQDPEAFHHDVFEVSQAADTPDEFHRLLADRKQQRLRELNEGLESAAVEIIANPSLIGTQQWQYALQLFRTKSLDSLVRYFASYIPEEHPWHRTQGSFYSSSSTLADDVPSAAPFFTGDDEKHILTDEPASISVSIPASHLPPSPRSMTMCSDSSAVSSPVDVDDVDHKYALNTLTPARTLSFSEPESDDSLTHSDVLSQDDGDMSQPDDADTPSTSVSDISESVTIFSDCHSSKLEAHDDDISTSQPDILAEEMESNTPTPRSELPGDSYVALRYSKSTTSLRNPTSPLYTHVLHEYVRSTRKVRRDASPATRRSPELGRVQKPLPDPFRVRPKGRRRVD